MIAYKFLAESGIGRFSERAWPLPQADGPGEWVSVAPPVSPCIRGIHATRASHLAYWLDNQLWQIELAGELVETESAVVAERGRLVRRIEQWNEAAWSALCAFCTERTNAMFERVQRDAPSELQRARFLVSEVDSFVKMGAYPTAVYVAAVAAHVASELEPEAAYRAERAAQAAFLVAHLGL